MMKYRATTYKVEQQCTQRKGLRMIKQTGRLKIEEEEKEVVKNN